MGKGAKTKSKKSESSNSAVKGLITDLFQKCVTPTASSTPSPKDLFNVYKEIHEMILNIEKQKGPSTTSQMGNRQECLTEFVEWSKKQNIQFESVELKSVRESELGVFATNDLSATELFIKVPKEAMLTSEMVAKSPISALVEDDPMLSSMPNVALALLLLYELYNEKSKWRPYINILPRSYCNLLYFDIEDVERLKGTSVFLEALNILRSIARQYAYINNLLFKHPLGKQLGLLGKITYADYKWAVATLMTRQNPIPLENGSTPGLALIPLLDMCNHREGPASIDYNPETQSCECFAPNLVLNGEEILIHYGSRPNTELVIYNGFFYEENTHDSIKLKLAVSKTDPHVAIRRELIGRLGLPESLPLGCLPSPLKDSLKAFLQISNASQQELDAMANLDTPALADGLRTETLVGKDTRRAYLKFLKDRCALLFRLIPTLAEPIVEPLHGLKGRSSYTANLSLTLRSNERKLLTDAILYIENELEALSD